MREMCPENSHPDQQVVCFWPCGTWCPEDQLEEYLQFKSDDFTKLTCPIEFEHEDIDAQVTAINYR